VIEVPQAQFDLFALSLPAGLAFGSNLPRGAWRTEDALTCGVLTQNEANRTFGVLIMRRREDDVWTVTQRELGLLNEARARDVLASGLVSGVPKERLPPGVPRRTPLWDLLGVTPSKVFALLMQPTHHVAAWVLNQLYLAMPRPDANWARDCQTGNFHTRLWEAHLLACLREQGLRVTQDHASPDFHIENHHGGDAWIEAVTANPPTPYDHFNTQPASEPETRRERLIGPAAVRFAKTLRSKLMKRYNQLPHVVGKPFALALADFQAPGSMIWSRVALPSYLYGLAATVIDRDGVKSAVAEEVASLLGPQAIPAGIFRSAEHAELSAVLFSNACSIAKLNRVGISAGADPKGYRYVRIGEFFDRTPGALTSIPFSLDITSPKYRALWPPYSYEPWSAELEVFHNPFARHPIPNELLPEATHWRLIDGEVTCSSFYETSILRSHTLVLKDSAPVPTVAQLFGKDEREEE
jgi:hypothetical protein